MPSWSNHAVTAFFGFFILLSSTFNAVSNDAEQVLEEVREIALEPDPNMSALHSKVIEWLKLQNQGPTAKAAWQKVQEDAERLRREWAALSEEKGTAAALAEKLSELNALTQPLHSSFSDDYAKLREVLAPLQERQMAEVDTWFASERTKECLRSAANGPAINRPGANPLQSQLVSERLLDWRAGEARPESQFACAFLQKATETVRGLFKAIEPKRYPELTKHFAWADDVLKGADPEEWMVYEHGSDAITLNAADGRIVISGLMAEVLVDVAVHEVFGSYEGLETQRDAIGDETPFEGIAKQVARLQSLGNDPETKRALQEQMFKELMGGSPEDLLEKFARGEPLTIEGNPFVWLGGEKQAGAAKFNEVLSQLFAFALFHEMGHIALGHDHKRNPACELAHDMEYEADAFAASAIARLTEGTVGINRKREIAGLKTFYRRFSDFGFDHDFDCPHPPIEARFERIEAAYRSTRATNDNRQLKQIQQQYSRKHICGQLPEAFRAKCHAKLRRQGIPE